MISVIILTLNEESNLPQCLDSVQWSDDVIVFDSFSSDRTIEIAHNYGARVVQRAFDNEKNQREASLRVPFKHPWVYNPDADEVTPDEMRDEMLATLRNESRPDVAYRARFKTMFMGRWIKHSSLYPTWVMRLFRPDKISFERTINLRYVADGPEGKLQSHFLHYTFNKGFNSWFAKHNQYSWPEAEETIKSLSYGDFSPKQIFRGNPTLRRRALKELSFRMPFRPSLRFFYMYWLRLGFLDGIPGYHYCRLLSIYEYMIVLKIQEIRRRQQGLTL